MRAIQREANLARRIAFEREKRDWTYDGTAKRLTDAGCPIQGSAVYKIEHGDPPRRITVDELVAFSDVFEIPVADLLLPPEVVADAAMHAALDRLASAQWAYEEARTHLESETDKVQRELQKLGLDLGEISAGLASGKGWMVADVTPPVAKKTTQRKPRRGK